MKLNETLAPWSLAIGLFAHGACGADHQVHPRLDVGASFLFSQQVEAGGVNEGTYSPRLDAIARNNADGLIFTIASGPKTEAARTKTILQTLYALAADACVVDVMNGTALMSGTGCERPLPEHQAWTIKDRWGTQTCELMRPATERVSVPAGEFDATKIECRNNEATSGRRTVNNYWYAATLGMMVKAVHRQIDSSGTEVSSVAEQLVSYELQTTP
jgi:hypothetical protein